MKLAEICAMVPSWLRVGATLTSDDPFHEVCPRCALGDELASALADASANDGIPYALLIDRSCLEVSVLEALRQLGIDVADDGIGKVNRSESGTTFVESAPHQLCADPVLHGLRKPEGEGLRVVGDGEVVAVPEELQMEGHPTMDAPSRTRRKGGPASPDKSITNSDASAPTPENVAFPEAEDKSARISKGSKEPHVRPADDFFETPAWVVAGILPHLPGGEVVDPCAGAGAIVAACLAAGRPARGTEYNGERALGAKHRGLPISAGDGLALLAVAPCPLIVMNPPYSAAETWVRAAVTPGRTVAVLLRLAFLEAACRMQLFADVGMPDVQVLFQRPSFTGDGNTDGAAYAWMIWGPGRGGRISHFAGSPPPKPKKGRSK